MSPYYVYAHATDDGEIFYIGKGKNRRAYHQCGRNQYWKNIKDKRGWWVVILESNLLESAAFLREKHYISIYSPRANMTSGGIGGYTGPNKGQFCKGIRPWNTGKICKQISNRQLGKKNHRFGKLPATIQSVVCLETGEIFKTIYLACENFGINRQSFYNYVKGKTRTARGWSFLYLYNDAANDRIRKSQELLINTKRREAAMKRKLLCLDTGEIFSSLKECADNFKIHPSNLCALLAGRKKRLRGLAFIYIHGPVNE